MATIFEAFVTSYQFNKVYRWDRLKVKCSIRHIEMHLQRLPSHRQVRVLHVGQLLPTMTTKRLNKNKYNGPFLQLRINSSSSSKCFQRRQCISCLGKCLTKDDNIFFILRTGQISSKLPAKLFAFTLVSWIVLRHSCKLQVEYDSKANS